MPLIKYGKAKNKKAHTIKITQLFFNFSAKEFPSEEHNFRKQSFLLPLLRKLENL